MIDAIFWGTIIPLLFLVIVLKRENRLIMCFFSWGLIAFAISLYINTRIVSQFGMSLNQLSITWAPVVEEVWKALPLIYYLIKSKDIDYPIQYFAMASGIGFSLQENYLYLIEHVGQVGSPVLYIVIRSITTCLMHGMTTALIGYGLQLVRKVNGMMLPVIFGLISLSVTLHALYNLYISSSLKLLAMVMPIILFMLGLLIEMPEDKSKKPVI